MIWQYQGYSSLSKTNITNCVSMHSTAFHYWGGSSTKNVSFCNFENLEAGSQIIQFVECAGSIERCNFLNNSQINGSYGLIYVESKRLDILDSVFQNNRKNNKGGLFYAGYKGDIYISM